MTNTKTNIINAENLVKNTCAIKGHRPPKLGGYEKDNPTALKVKKILSEQIIKHIEEYKVTRFICGAALGVDQIALEILSDLKQNQYSNIHIILALPFAEYRDRCWFKASTENITEISKTKADEVINVETLEGYEIDPDEVSNLLNEQLKKRNHYAVDKSAYLLTVWDKSNGGTGGCVDYFNSQPPVGRKLTIINIKNDTIESIDN